MKEVTVGLIDYGMGNHSSVTHCLRKLGFRVRVSDSVEVLDGTDLLLLPGVGAFPSAMEELHRRNLVGYLQEQARADRAIIGVCLGMQLLTGASHEHIYTTGLDLIPGEFVPFRNRLWHIGWNTLECTQPDPLIEPSDGKAFYFNHAFCYSGPQEFQVTRTHHPDPFVSAIRRGRVIGLQFHPEKSQEAGLELLRNLIGGLCHA